MNYLLLQEEQDFAYYAPSQLAQLDLEYLPKHVAFIPDGNRRWARRRETSISTGHREGADTLMDIVKAAKALGIKVASFFIFSTENWKRDPIEIQALLWLIESYITEKCPSMIENGVKLNAIGDLERLPVSLQRAIQETKDATAHCECIDMVLALNYGGRDEIRRALQRMKLDKALDNNDVTENLINQYMDTAQWPDLDLLIRTSGEQRVSNFLLWQMSYAELYTTPVLWPDFTPQHLLDAILDYQKRERRRGGK